MGASSRRKYRLKDYLSVEEESAVRHEYLDGEIFAMAGGTPEHAALAAAVSGIRNAIPSRRRT
jgi:Uma2 family endonuclease